MKWNNYFLIALFCTKICFIKTEINFTCASFNEQLKCMIYIEFNIESKHDSLYADASYFFDEWFLLIIFRRNIISTLV